MSAHWVKLTNKATDEPVYVNMPNASAIYPFENGSRIFFVGGAQNEVIIVREPPVAILELLREVLDGPSYRAI
jgi:hypothetical protein